jgi:hypothetical protein
MRPLGGGGTPAAGAWERCVLVSMLVADAVVVILALTHPLPAGDSGSRARFASGECGSLCQVLHPEA